MRIKQWAEQEDKADGNFMAGNICVDFKYRSVYTYKLEIVKMVSKKCGFFSL